MNKIKTFIDNFLKAMNNEVLGHSLKKWLAVGTFWLIVIITLKFTNASNLEGVLVILCSLLFTLMGLNVADKKVNNPKPGEPEAKPSEDPNNPPI